MKCDFHSLWDNQHHDIQSSPSWRLLWGLSLTSDLSARECEQTDPLIHRGLLENLGEITRIGMFLQGKEAFLLGKPFLIVSIVGHDSKRVVGQLSEGWRHGNML